MAIIVAHFQLGKFGLTENFIEALRNAFKTHKAVKIAVLKTGTRDKEKMDGMGKEICEKLSDREYKYEYRIIGFTMTVRRFRKK